MNKRDTAFWNDQRLMELATYHETKGLTVKIQDPELLQNRFTDFKTLIHKGSFTMKQLSDDVYSKFGITTDAEQKPATIQDMLAQTLKMSDEFRKREQRGSNGKEEKK